MTATTRTRRRDVSARLRRMLVVMVSFGAAAGLALIVRSCQDGRGFTSPAADGPAARDAAPPSAAPRDPLPAGASASVDAARDSDALPPIDDLRSRFLTVPVEGVTPEQLVSGFASPRGDRPHEAIDILAPRGTPVVAVEAGRIARLFTSRGGGLTIYQFDPTERFAYFYAHLDGYADGLAEGASVRRGQRIGYVGTSGNAPRDTPHLHFAIFELGPERRWSDGLPLDPYLVWRPAASTSD